MLLRVLDDAVVKYCNIPEDDHPVYDPDHVYIASEKVISNGKRYQAVAGKTIAGIDAWAGDVEYAPAQCCYVEDVHRIYQCNIANTAKYPPNYSVDSKSEWTEIGVLNRGIALTDGTAWAELGPTNRAAALDAYSHTQTIGIPVEGGHAIEWHFNASRCNGLALFNVAGSRVDVECLRNGVTLWTRTIRLSQRGATKLFPYFFGPWKQLRANIFEPFPLSFGAELRVRIFGHSLAKCGAVAIGTTRYVGDVRLGMRLDTADSSKITEDAFGVVSYSKGLTRKKRTVEIEIENRHVSWVDNLFAGLSGTPAVYILDNSERTKNTIEAMLTLAIKSTFSIVVDHGTYSYCNLETTGM
jgi:hypothetical protein